MPKTKAQPRGDGSALIGGARETTSKNPTDSNTGVQLRGDSKTFIGRTWNTTINNGATTLTEEFKSLASFKLAVSIIKAEQDAELKSLDATIAVLKSERVELKTKLESILSGVDVSRWSESDKSELKAKIKSFLDSGPSDWAREMGSETLEIFKEFSKELLKRLE